MSTKQKRSVCRIASSLPAQRFASGNEGHGPSDCPAYSVVKGMVAVKPGTILAVCLMAASLALTRSPIQAQGIDTELSRSTRFGPSWANIGWTNTLDGDPYRREVHLGPFTWGDKFDNGWQPDWRKVDIGTSIPIPIGETGAVGNFDWNRHWEDRGYTGGSYEPFSQSTTVGTSLAVPAGDIGWHRTWVNTYQPDLHDYSPSSRITDFGASLGGLHADRIWSDTYNGNAYIPSASENTMRFEIPKIDIPKIEIPRIDIPKIDIPEIPKIDIQHYDTLR